MLKNFVGLCSASCMSIQYFWNIYTALDCEVFNDAAA